MKKYMMLLLLMMTGLFACDSSTENEAPEGAANPSAISSTDEKITKTSGDIVTQEESLQSMPKEYQGALANLVPSYVSISQHSNELNKNLLEKEVYFEVAEDQNPKDLSKGLYKVKDGEVTTYIFSGTKNPLNPGKYTGKVALAYGIGENNMPAMFAEGTQTSLALTKSPVGESAYPGTKMPVMTVAITNAKSVTDLKNNSGVINLTNLPDNFLTMARSINSQPDAFSHYFQPQLGVGSLDSPTLPVCNRFEHSVPQGNPPRCVGLCSGRSDPVTCCATEHDQPRDACQRSFCNVHPDDRSCICINDPHSPACLCEQSPSNEGCGGIVPECTTDECNCTVDPNMKWCASDHFEGWGKCCGKSQGCDGFLVECLDPEPPSTPASTDTACTSEDCECVRDSNKQWCPSNFDGEMGVCCSTNEECGFFWFMY